MRYIEKTEPPQSFKRWKRPYEKGVKGGERKPQPTWEVFKYDHRKIFDDLTQSLLAEQGNICCYCGIRIGFGKAQIEHFKPKSKYNKLTYDYLNLLASCTSMENCGEAKEDWFDAGKTISPLNEACEKRFRFLDNGWILPASANDEGASETISRLKLNSRRLIALRKNAVSEAFGILFESDFQNHELGRAAKAATEERFKQYAEKDSTGEFKPFCFAVTSVLKEYIE